MQSILLGATLLIGTIVGAGVFGLPYAYSLAGFPLGVLSLIVAEVLLISTSLFLVEMGRRGDEIPDILERYLGKIGKLLTSISLILLTVGAISAYNRGIGESLEIITGIRKEMLMALIAILVAILSYLGIRSIAGSEEVLVSLLIAFMIFLSFFMIKDMKIQNLRYIDPRFFFYALGASIFASSGYSAVPELLKIGDKRKCYTSILLAHIFVFLLYFLFSMAFVGNFGRNVKQLAVENLKGSLEIFGLIIAIIAMLTSYIALAFVLYNVYKDSLRIPWQVSIILTFGIPYTIAFFTGAGFTDLISTTGGIAMPLTGFLVGLSYWKYSEKKLGKFIGFTNAGIYLVLLLETITRMVI